MGWGDITPTAQPNRNSKAVSMPARPAPHPPHSLPLHLLSSAVPPRPVFVSPKGVLSEPRGREYKCDVVFPVAVIPGVLVTHFLLVCRTTWSVSLCQRPRQVLPLRWPGNPHGLGLTWTW